MEHVYEYHQVYCTLHIREKVFRELWWPYPTDTSDTSLQDCIIFQTQGLEHREAIHCTSMLKKKKKLKGKKNKKAHLFY